jgi:5-methylcytosine-specific restriction protein B
MIENYLNDDAKKYFSTIDTDENRDWVWRFIAILKQRFPNADHWVTGGVKFTYTDIRIGKKTPNLASGSPVMYFRLSGNTPLFSIHEIIKQSLENSNIKFEVARPEIQRTDEQINAWLDQYEQAILSVKQKHLEGHGYNPVAYKLPDDGKEEIIEGQYPVKKLSPSDSISPLNQILYGPPGTGKTYSTIDESLRILDSSFFEKNKGNREALKKRFDELVSTGEIRFTTFHQSFSYEDFVEGLRAVNNDDKQLEYVVEPGIFKQVCDDARTQNLAKDIGIKKNPNIWKISINGTGSSATKTYCISHDEARIGWGQTGDLKANGKESDYFKNVGTSNQGTLQYFCDEIEDGDIVLCIQSAQNIGAIGVVVGDYRYEEQVPSEVIDTYQHVRKVNWLYRDLDLSVLPLNSNKQFTLKTVYSITRFSWGDLLSYLEQSGIKPSNATQKTVGTEPRVLVIDEINRGNISRIFGELITLIEPSKRAGAGEALSVTLPYSKKPFSVPSNVYLIGTMNTADRSLAGLDIALRRRFTFKEMPPKPEELEGIDVEGINIASLLRTMNERIEVLLDRDHCLGHAYFMPLKQAEKKNLIQLKSIFSQQILPLLKEYFFEDWERIAWVLNDQNKSDDNHKFIRKAPSNINELFGNKVASSLQNIDQRWHLNQSAFDDINSYRLILGANQ